MLYLSSYISSKCIEQVRKHICGNLDDSGAGGQTMQDVC